MSRQARGLVLTPAPVALMNEFPSKSITPVPERAKRAPLALVVDAFLVRTADDAVGNRDRTRTVCLDELDDFRCDNWVRTHVTRFKGPRAHFLGRGAFMRYHANGDLARPA